MPLVEKDSFRFTQFHVIDLNECDGWCAGMSTAMLLYLRECYRCGLENQSLETVFHRVKEYADTLRMSYNSFNNQVTPGAGGFRHNMEKFQSAYTRDAGAPGSWEYKFDTRGAFLINITISDKYTKCGSQYISAYNFMAGSNHAGLLVTNDLNSFFLFDPNAGGGIFLWSQCGEIKNIKCAVDAALDILYRKNDRLRGERFGRFNAAKRLDYNNARYNHSV